LAKKLKLLFPRSIKAQSAISAFFKHFLFKLAGKTSLDVSNVFERQLLLACLIGILQNVNTKENELPVCNEPLYFGYS